MRFNFREDGSIHLDQEEYVNELLRRFHMTEVNGVKKPMECGTKVPENNGSVTNKPFRSIIGGLAYLATHTQPDIAYAINELSHHQQKPSEVHWNMAKRILRYLAGTRSCGLLFEIGEAGFEVYSDANFVSTVNKKSTFGSYVSFNRCHTGSHGLSQLELIPLVSQNTLQFTIQSRRPTVF